MDQLKTGISEMEGNLKIPSNSSLSLTARLKHIEQVHTIGDTQLTPEIAELESQLSEKTKEYNKIRKGVLDHVLASKRYWRERPERPEFQFQSDLALLQEFNGLYEGQKEEFDKLKQKVNSLQGNLNKERNDHISTRKELTNTTRLLELSSTITADIRRYYKASTNVFGMVDRIFEEHKFNNSTKSSYLRLMIVKFTLQMLKDILIRQQKLSSEIETNNTPSTNTSTSTRRGRISFSTTAIESLGLTSFMFGALKEYARIMAEEVSELILPKTKINDEIKYLSYEIEQLNYNHAHHSLSRMGSGAPNLRVWVPSTSARAPSESIMTVPPVQTLGETYLRKLYGFQKKTLINTTDRKVYDETRTKLKELIKPQHEQIRELADMGLVTRMFYHNLEPQNDIQSSSSMNRGLTSSASAPPAASSQSRVIKPSFPSPRQARPSTNRPTLTPRSFGARIPNVPQN
jgi:hypothetical protein